jgi:hypothetical protein
MLSRDQFEKMIRHAGASRHPELLAADVLNPGFRLAPE